MRSKNAAVIVLLALGPLACVIDPTGEELASGTGQSGAGSSTSASSDAASSSTGSPAGTGGSDPGVENCTNGIDDDRDGKEDCEDSDCPDFECLPLQPRALAYGTAIPPSGACASGYDRADYVDCQGECACEAVDGSCAIDFVAYTTEGCDSANEDIRGTGNGCGNSANAELWIRATADLVDGAACDPSPGENYQGQPIAACSLGASSVGTCGRESVCVPKLSAGEPRCALVPADVACVAPYVEKVQLLPGVVGTECVCACERGPQSCQGAAVSVYSEVDGCAGAVVVLPANGECLEAGYAKSVWAGTTPASAECEARASIADAESTLPIKLCCVPPS